MTNDGLEKALALTWENKQKFYEDTKNFSLLEIVKGIEKKYARRSSPHPRRTTRNLGLSVKVRQLAGVIP